MATKGTLKKAKRALEKLQAKIKSAKEKGYDNAAKRGEEIERNIQTRINGKNNDDDISSEEEKRLNPLSRTAKNFKPDLKTEQIEQSKIVDQIKEKRREFERKVKALEQNDDNSEALKKLLEEANEQIVVYKNAYAKLMTEDKNYTEFNANLNLAYELINKGIDSFEKRIAAQEQQKIQAQTASTSTIEAENITAEPENITAEPENITAEPENITAPQEESEFLADIENILKTNPNETPKVMPDELDKVLADLDKIIPKQPTVKTKAEVEKPKKSALDELLDDIVNNDNETIKKQNETINKKLEEGSKKLKTLAGNDYKRLEGLLDDAKAKADFYKKGQNSTNFDRFQTAFNEFQSEFYKINPTYSEQQNLTPPLASIEKQKNPAPEPLVQEAVEDIDTLIGEIDQIDHIEAQKLEKLSEQDKILAQKRNEVHVNITKLASEIDDLKPEQNNLEGRLEEINAERKKENISSYELTELRESEKETLNMLVDNVIQRFTREIALEQEVLSLRNQEERFYNLKVDYHTDRLESLENQIKNTTDPERKEILEELRGNESKELRLANLYLTQAKDDKHEQEQALIDLKQKQEQFENKASSYRIKLEEIERNRQNALSQKQEELKIFKQDVQKQIDRSFPELKEEQNIEKLRSQFIANQNNLNAKIADAKRDNEGLADDLRKLGSSRSKENISSTELADIRKREKLKLDAYIGNLKTINQLNLSKERERLALFTRVDDYYKNQCKSLTDHLVNLFNQIQKTTDPERKQILTEEHRKLSLEFEAADKKRIDAIKLKGKAEQDIKNIEQRIHKLEGAVEKHKNRLEEMERNRQAEHFQKHNKKLVDDLFKRLNNTPIDKRGERLGHYKDLKDTYQTQIEKIQGSHLSSPEQQENLNKLKANCEQLKLHLEIFRLYLAKENEKVETSAQQIKNNNMLIKQIDSEIRKMDTLIKDTAPKIGRLAYFSNDCNVLTEEKANQKGLSLKQYRDNEIKRITGLSVGSEEAPSITSDKSNIRTTATFQEGNALRMHDIDLKIKGHLDKDVHFHVAAVERLNNDNVYVQEFHFDPKKMAKLSEDECLRFAAIAIQNKLVSDPDGPIVIAGKWPQNLVKAMALLCEAWELDYENKSGHTIEPVAAKIEEVKIKLNDPMFRKSKARFGMDEKVLETKEKVKEKEMELGIKAPEPLTPVAVNKMGK